VGRDGLEGEELEGEEAGVVVFAGYLGDEILVA